MKAITLWQPWASLWGYEIKKYETRSWGTSYRGPIAIHAAALNPFKAIRPIPNEAVMEMRKALKERRILASNTDFRILPRGCVIAKAELVGCHEMVRHGGRGLSSASPAWIETDQVIYEPTEQELLFGDWTPGRFAWEISDIKILPKPIPAKGNQRLWEWGG